MEKDFSLNGITTEDFRALVDADNPVAILLPVGSVEPHGPHLTLLTDTIISTASAERAALRLHQQGITTLIAPAVAYGVTNCASGFCGAISIPARVLTEYVQAVAQGFLSSGVNHICLINNHLEPEHFAAISAVPNNFEKNQVSVACPLARRWARTLSDEFKRGECHAGRYETAIVLAAKAQGVKLDIQRCLPEVPISLSDKLNSGIENFKDMGMDQAYAGAPALATAAEGEQLLNKLATMIVTEVCNCLTPMP